MNSNRRMFFSASLFTIAICFGLLSGCGGGSGSSDSEGPWDLAGSWTVSGICDDIPSGSAGITQNGDSISVTVFSGPILTGTLPESGNTMILSVQGGGTCNCIIESNDSLHCSCSTDSGSCTARIVR